MNIRKVGVLGAGLMGSGIGQVVAAAGFSVCIGDVDVSALSKGKSRIEINLKKMVQKGGKTTEETGAILNRMRWSTDFSDVVSEVDLVIEAVPENLELKSSIFTKLGEAISSTAIVASNTSSFSITLLASYLKNPQRAIGLHWFNPPTAMKLVEIIKGMETTQETVQTICDFAGVCDKETVVCNDSQGFIVTRSLVALRLECYRIYSEGIASKEDIDKALKLGLGHPMGQFELADFSGLDLEPPICEGLEKVFGERFKAPQILLNLVRAGHLGRKSGKGWYDYTTNRSEKNK
jgi:3-hydroxybutyryl-CoA dehydrogenase